VVRAGSLRSPPKQRSEDRAPRAPGWSCRINSTLNLLGPDYALITHSDDPACQQQTTTATAAGIPVTVRAVNTGAQHEAGPQSWHTLCGIPKTGAVLDRPDGHIAWTAPRPPSDAELLTVLRRILTGL
jgi:putative polyketide hydroxylase